MSDAAKLSRLLFEARESLSMWRDVVESQTGRKDNYTTKLIARVDEFRAEQGWSANGYGGES